MSTKTTFLATLLVICGLLTTNAAFAANKDLLDILLANGSITQQQYEELLEKEVLEEKDVTAAVVNVDKGGISIKSPSSGNSIDIGMRLHAEMSTHDGNLPDGVTPNNGTELRRARLQTKGKIASNWSWAAEADFADNKVSIKDFWVAYSLQNGTKIYFGHQKQPFNLALEMSSNDLPFIERAVDNFLVAPFVDRAIGLRVEKNGSNWFAAGGIFGDSVSPGSSTGDEGWGVAGRFVYTPIIEDNRVLHLGVRAASRAPDTSEESVRLRDETTHLSNLRIVDTGTIANVDRTNLYGIEAGYATGPFSIVGEYNEVSNEINGGDDLTFDGWNIYSTWSLTGESRAAGYAIKSGEFKRLKPYQTFDPKSGSWGAWELALRYANINLNDASVTGGEESVLTSGINWYPNSNIRFMLEWSQIVDTDDSSELREAADGLDIYQFRAQYTF